MKIYFASSRCIELLLLVIEITISLDGQPVSLDQLDAGGHGRPSWPEGHRLPAYLR